MMLPAPHPMTRQQRCNRGQTRRDEQGFGDDEIEPVTKLSPVTYPYPFGWRVVTSTLLAATIMIVPVDNVWYRGDMTLGRTPGYRRWAGMPIMVCYFDFFGHLWLTFRDFSRFQAFFLCLDTLGSSRNTGEHRRGGLVCLALHNGMLFRFFGHFLLIFHYFSWFHVFFTRLDAPGSPRNTGEHWRGWAGTSNPLKWYVTSIFWPFCLYFPFFFAILCDFHAFGCAWRA